MGMKLHDRIYRLSNEQWYPAYVYSYQQAEQSIDIGGTWLDPQGKVFYVVDETLQAIVHPGPNWSMNENVRWRGRTYVISTVAYRTRGGKDHHITLILRRDRT